MNMNILQKIGKLASMVDFFNSSQLMRLDKESDYRTITGGVMSIALITTILIAFNDMIGDTLNRNTISYTQSTIMNIDPSKIEMKASPKDNFMFGISLGGYNLNKNYKFFDVIAYQLKCKNGCHNYEILPLEL